MELEHKKIAIVCDWIKDWGGAELVLSHLLEIFPQADIFTSVFFQEENPVFAGRKVTTSFIQKLPLFGKSHKLALMLRPKAFESFDLSSYDIVISSSSAESKGVITKPNCLHICYCHTPTRYYWSHYHEYLKMMEFGILNPLGRWVMPKVVHGLRKWDFTAAARPDYFIANSHNTKTRIEKYYEREATVIYPSIDVESFDVVEEKEDFYLYVGRCIPYKRFDLVVDAFNENGKKVKIITNTDNKLFQSLRERSNENIEWLLGISREETQKLFSQAQAFLFPPEEDFGLVPVEAMACGTPVIAYGKGGALETVIDGETGIFFPEQTVESLNDAIGKFETMKFSAKKIQKHAQHFDTKQFKKHILAFVEEKLSKKTL